MTTESSAPVAPAAPANDSVTNVAASLPANAPTEFTSETSAAKYLADLRWKRARGEADAPKEEPAESADPATADTELAQANDGAEEPPVEDASEPEPEAEKLPPIERPRSWSKDDDDEWNALPRARQEKIVANERAREADIRQRINDAAETAKAAKAEATRAEQVRTQYEGKLKSVVGMLEKEQLRDFPDLRSMDDIERMTAEMLAASDGGSQHYDPLKALQLQGRLRAWDVHQQKLQAAHYELTAAEQRQREGQKTDWGKHVQTENELAAKAIPDLADKEKGPTLQRRAAERLVELGFSQEELNDLASGEKRISVYDHRLQQLIFSDLQLGDLRNKTKADEVARKAAIAKAAPKTVPPVQRPGTTKPAGSVESAKLQDLSKKLTASGSEKDALALLVARRAAQRRG